MGGGGGEKGRKKERKKKSLEGLDWFTGVIYLTFCFDHHLFIPFCDNLKFSDPCAPLNIAIMFLPTNRICLGKVLQGLYSFKIHIFSPRVAINTTLVSG